MTIRSINYTFKRIEVELQMLSVRPNRIINLLAMIILDNNNRTIINIQYSLKC